MKIFAVARNYGGICDVSPYGEGEEPVWYELPDSSQLHTCQPFFVPDFGDDFRIMPSLAVRVCRLGKGIAPRYAARYIDAVGLGCNVISAGLLASRRRDGLPWAAATAFDKSCLLSPWREAQDIADTVADTIFTLECGGNRLTYHAAMMRRDIGEILQLLSRDITLKNGDVILAALHPSGLPASIGDKLIATDNNPEHSAILDINIR